MPKFQHKEQSIYYQIEGEGKTLLFLHGFLEDHSMWKDIYPAFVEIGYKCVLVDLPCHGQSRFKGNVCKMSFMAEAIDELLKRLKINVFISIGHSMGGYVSLELNALRSNQVILLHSNFWSDSDQKKIDRDRVVELVKINKSRFIKEAIPGLFAAQNKNDCALIIDQLIEKALTIPTNEIIASTLGMRNRKAHYSIRTNKPLKIIHGALDTVITTELLSKEILKLTLQPELIELTEIGHMSIWEDSKSLIKTLKTLLIS